MFALLLVALFLAPAVLARGRAAPPPPPPDPDTDWASHHLRSEHHLDNFDPGAFFALHDFDESGGWTPDEVRRMYGLEDASLKDLSKEKREEVTRVTFRIFDEDRNGIIEREEWLRAVRRGDRLRDFGLGPGHHGDDEYEYEIHHFERFHGPDTTEADLTHPEDIEHFAKHDKEDDEAERWRQLNRQAVIQQNIPQMFRRHKP